jgi:glycosyltransferase involved in cell wall biosynthesis
VNGTSGAPGYDAYLRAREAVLAMKRVHGGGPLDPSGYWREELENIDYLIEASPLIVRKLRHHAFHITGIRPYDYRSKGDGRREHFESRLRALGEVGGDALLVPESPALGGYGYDIGGRLFNVDTLKFYEVLIGMDRGGVLAPIRAAARPVVCEIGPGWAGFAYQFKTLFPRCTYVLVDFPELFLFSATYLAAVFPDARLHFVTEATPAALEGWRQADFVFLPNTAAHLLEATPLDLLVNMVSFQEMTDAQVRGYADLAARAGCPLLYSLNRERSPYNTELVSVREALADHYTITEVPVLDTDYTSATRKPPKPGKAVERSELSYRHLVGRLAAPGARRGRPADTAAAPNGGPRVVLGMTLYNNARHLPEAIESLLAQQYSGFALVLLDDASTDDTEAIARRYVERDPRIRYERHAGRRAMIATWREVAERARALYPDAEYFAWVSDHDRWHPRWLGRLVEELDAAPSAVIAYPITRRMDHAGDELAKGPRLFDTVGAADLRARWARFCHEGIGSGDMVYGLMRMDALMAAGIFRTVLRPDRLLMAELALRGDFRQVPEVLWFRRQSETASVDRQHATLVAAGQEPAGFNRPPWLQHAALLWREYVKAEPRPLPVSTAAWLGMLLRYQLTYGWRHFRKTEASHAVGRGIDRVIWVKKITKHYYHRAVYETLVGGRAAWGRVRRGARRAVYEVLVLTHRLGLRGPRQTP